MVEYTLDGLRLAGPVLYGLGRISPGPASHIHRRPPSPRRAWSAWGTRTSSCSSFSLKKKKKSSCSSGGTAIRPLPSTALQNPGDDEEEDEKDEEVEEPDGEEEYDDDDRSRLIIHPCDLKRSD